MELELDVSDIKWAKESRFGGIDFLSQLTEQELTALIYKIRKIEFKAGKIILFQGEFSNRLFLIKTGKVAVFVAKEGKKIRIAELTEKSYFGETSLIQPVAASATVVAEEDSEILILERETIEEVFKNKPTVLETIHKKIEERKSK
ncbi:MAG: cyclic nucleotide-binding domain-containing protein [Elusimicrobiota bacterium]